MSLAQKTLLIIFVTLAALLVILYNLSARVFLHSFTVLEEQQVNLNLQRVNRAMQSDLAELETVAADDTRSADPAALPVEFNDQTLARLDLNIIQYYDDAHRLVYSRAVRVQDGSAVALPAGYNVSLVDYTELFSVRSGQPAGVVLFSEGAALVAAHSFASTPGATPSGTLILGRLLDSQETARLASLTQTDLQYIPLNTAGQDPLLQEVTLRLKSDPTSVIVQPYGELNVRGYTTLSDLNGTPAVLMYVSMPRSIYQEGQAAIRSVLISGAIIGLVAGALSLLLTQRLVLSRLSRLMAGVARVGASSDPSTRVDLPGNDELSQLAGAINATLGSLESAQIGLKLSEDRVRRQLENINQLYTASLELTRRLEPGEVAGALVTACVEVFGAGYAWFGMLKAPDRVRWLASAGGSVKPSPDGDDGASRPEIHLDSGLLERDPTVLDGFEAAREFEPAAFDPGLKNLTSCALFALDDLAGSKGVLAVYSHSREYFSNERIEVLQTYLNQAGAAFRQADLFQQVLKGRRRLQDLSRKLVEVQETERRALASELHDEIGQALTALKLNVDVGLRSASPAEAGRLKQAQEMVNELLSRVRELTLELRPPMLDDLGLLPTLVWLFGRVQQQTGLAVDFRHSGLERRFPPEIETAAYRIIQEALTNVARHAGVTKARVRCRASREQLDIEVADHGRGFNVDEALAAGESSGLSGMRERANLLGGQVMIVSAPGNGAALKAELPLEGRIERRRRSRE
jgi:signal transduction histidine kinase